MSEMTIDSLKDIMREAAGEDDSGQAGLDILDMPFIDLGFDSLALLETVALIKRKHGVNLADDALTELKTPREMLSRVNSELTRA
jgi:act minimal PKS acyl carrier protein